MQIIFSLTLFTDPPVMVCVHVMVKVTIFSGSVEYFYNDAGNMLSIIILFII